MPMRLTAAVICLLCYGGILRAADHLTEKAAEKLVATTVTVRSFAAPIARGGPGARRPPLGSAKDIDAAVANSDRTADAHEVTVCSGVSLGKGLIVTFHAMPAADAPMPRFRITLPGGDQAEARLRVIDRHSGLVLLEIDDIDAPGLSLARAMSKVGSTVLTAAAAGIEEPAVSAGILGATERTPPGIDLPPLLQCDVRTTETSSGAAVVNASGELLGIVAGTGNPGSHGGWTYALPVHHVERLLKAKVDGKLIELKRRRPVVGFTIGAGEREGTVIVERVAARGPAALAGIKPGDSIVETDGLKIRSAYQAIDLILNKQPGDRMRFTVRRDNQPLQFEVLLDGGDMPASEIPQSNVAAIKIGPQLKARRTDGGEIRIRDNNAPVEVSVNPTEGETRRSVGNEAELLRLQLEAYERVIEGMQKEIGLLRRETSELRDRLKEGAKE
jgi:serine protease DegS